MDVLINQAVVGIENSFLTLVSWIISVALEPEVLLVLGLGINLNHQKENLMLAEFLLHR